MPANPQTFTLTVQTPRSVIPDLAGDKRDALLAFARLFEAMAGGMAPGQPGDSLVSITTASDAINFTEATGTLTLASAAVNNTAVLNGSTFTAKKQRATGTLVAATAIAGTTAVIGGVTFTGVAGAPVLAGDFSIDTGNTETAASLAAAINAHASLAGIVTATSATDTVTVRAVTSGTAGNAITLVGTAIVLVASAATLTGGIAVAENEFDISPGGTNAQGATDLARSINASTVGAAKVVKACNLATTVALAAVLAGDYVEIDGIRFTAVQGASPERVDTFDMSGSNTADCTALHNKINAHPVLSRRVLSVDGGAGTLTLRQKDGTTGIRLSASSSTFTLGATTLAESAVVLVTAQQPGVIGAAIRTTATGNITAGAAVLANGDGGQGRTTYLFT